MSRWRSIWGAAVAICAAAAVAACSDDGPTGLKPAALPELFGGQLYRADGSPVSVSILEGETFVGIYFASAGCPACGAFTPILEEAYAQFHEDGRSFEVVLVTSGISEAGLFEFMTDSGMPWLAISPHSPKVDALLQRFYVRWVPTLIIIDGSGNTVSLSGREDVLEEGAGAYDSWLAAGTPVN